jgi:uncharacterized membrane protein (UPF0127 family)
LGVAIIDLGRRPLYLIGAMIFPHTESAPIARRKLLQLAGSGALLLASRTALAQLARFPTAELTIDTTSGPHKFSVEVATTPDQLEQGLMFRQSLAPDGGMLFDFKSPQPTMMWMKNTLIPLDMLFVDQQGRIVNIHERAVPGSLETIGSSAPVRAVIELNGGTAARLGIKPGNRVVFPIFGNAS